MNLFRNLTLTLALVATFALGAFVATPTEVSAQRNQNQTANVGQLVSGLINVNVGAVQVDIDTGDITVVDVDNVLNNNEIRILNNVLNNNTILSNNSNFLNNLLQDAEIITDNQVVVGVLSGGIIVVQDVTA